MYLKVSSSCYTNQQNYTDFLASLLTDRRETHKNKILLMILFIHLKRILVTLLKNIRQINHWHNNKRWQWQEDVPSTSHVKAPVLCTVVLWAWIHCHKKTSRYDKLYHTIWILIKTIWFSLYWRIKKIACTELTSKKW